MVARPVVGLDLPLRVVVWSAADGRVRASHQDSAGCYELPAGLEKNISAVAALVDAAVR